MFRELFENKKITDINQISLGDKLYIENSSEKYLITINKINRQFIEGSIDKNFGGNDMILVSYRKKNFLKEFDVYTKEQKPEMFI